MTDSSSSAREEILAHIRSANQNRVFAITAADIAWQALPRCYARKGHLPPEGRLHLFEERLIDYGAHVYHERTEELARGIEGVFISRRKNKILRPAGLPVSWLPAGIDFICDDGLDAFDLDGYEGVLTLATVAIAATGTILLQNRAGQGRRALSLVPDYHLCIVSAEQVVETVPEAFERLAETSQLPTTFISGPSATADIEMTRIQGVHGPRFLDVILAYNA